MTDHISHTDLLTPESKRHQLENHWSKEAFLFRELCARRIVDAPGLNVTISIPKNMSIADYDIVRRELEKNGWATKRDKGFDQRDGEGWDNLQISPQLKSDDRMHS